MKKFLLPAIVGMLAACQPDTVAPPLSLLAVLDTIPSLAGKPEYLSTPYIAAGDRLYAVGHQDGSFPDLGWHVTGEMGGIWSHPIKLLDGFVLNIGEGTNSWCLTDAQQFVNYPVANRHLFALNDLEVQRVQFAPDGLEGLVVEYSIKNSSPEKRTLQLAFSAMTDLSPVWLSERLNITDGPDLVEADLANQMLIARDSLNPWWVAVSTSQPLDSIQIGPTTCSYPRRGLGKDGTIYSSVTLASGQTQTIQYYIAGSSVAEMDARTTLNILRQNPADLLARKVLQYAQVQQTARIQVPDSSIQQLYEWTKYTTQWLIREVPAIGRGLSAGTPDYPWWFGTDNTYALQGWLVTGQHAEVKATLELLLKLSAPAGNGQIVHEVSTNGVVFNPGNLNTTAYFIHLLWQYYQWTGDRSFVANVFPEVKKGLEWLTVTQDKDQNGYPDGPGMMEIHGLHSEMIDVVVYTQAAFQAASQMATLLKEPETAANWQQQAHELRNRINQEWWVEQAGSFADFRATRSETIGLINAAIVRADTLQKPWAVEELQATWQQVARLRDNRTMGAVVHHNWVVNTPMELGVADPEKALRALKTAEKYTNRFGMYVTGIDRDENMTEASKWQSFSYVGAVMTLPTGVQAIAEARYGRPDESLAYLRKLANGFSYALPGSMYEVSPDYGMIAQAWNIYAVAVPIVAHYFGVQPHAGQQQITIKPQFPSKWENAALTQLPVGENLLDFEKAGNVYRIRQTKPWTMRLVLPSGKKIWVDEQATMADEANGASVIELSGLSHEVRLE